MPATVCHRLPRAARMERGHAGGRAGKMQWDVNLMALYVASVVVMIALPGPVTVFVAGTALAGGTR